MLGYMPYLRRPLFCLGRFISKQDDKLSLGLLQSWCLLFGFFLDLEPISSQFLQSELQ